MRAILKRRSHPDAPKSWTPALSSKISCLTPFRRLPDPVPLNLRLIHLDAEARVHWDSELAVFEAEGHGQEVVAEAVVAGVVWAGKVGRGRRDLRDGGGLETEV